MSTEITSSTLLEASPWRGGDCAEPRETSGDIGRQLCRVGFYLLPAFLPLRLSQAAPCFPAPVWFHEVADATALKSPLLQRPVMIRGFVAGALNNIDARLQLAIAGQETFFGLRGPCPGVRNAWGILDSQGRCRGFATWDFAVS